MSSCSKIIRFVLQSSRRSLCSSSLSPRSFSFSVLHTQSSTSLNPLPSFISRFIWCSLRPISPFSSFLTLRLFNSTSAEGKEDSEEDPLQYETTGEGETTDGWEEEDEVKPEVGDGGDGGGVVLKGVPWGEQAFTIVREVLSRFDDDLKLYAFKTTPSGYVYVRLDKLSNEFGCPNMEELERFSQEYKKKLDEGGALGEVPNGLALEVSSPGAERILKVPDDLSRFKGMPMTVCYVDDVESNCPEKNGIFLLESVEPEAETCVWKLADVKENRDPQSKGRPLSRKQKDWRLRLPFGKHGKVTLYLDY